MTLTQWLLLCLIFTAYLLLGGTIFMILEEEPGALEQVKLATLRRDVQEVLFHMDQKFYHNDTPAESLHLVRAAKEAILARVSEVACGGTKILVQNTDEDDSISDGLHWDFYNSVIYGFTIVTTIGYGHLTPRSDWSRCAAVLFGLIGIPLNGILLSTLGDYFSSKLIKVFRQSKDDKVTMIFRLSFYLCPGTIVFIVVPAAIFAGMEKWSFTESIYFACISLMTVGFGDFVPGKEPGEGGGLWVYKIFIIVWIQFGLGYLFMILSFITKGLRHKKVRSVIEKRLKAMNTTKEQLLKDLEDMRMVMEDPFIRQMQAEMYHQHEKIAVSVENKQFFNDHDGDRGGDHLESFDDQKKAGNSDHHQHHHEKDRGNNIFNLYDHLRRRSIVRGVHFGQRDEENGVQIMLQQEFMAAVTRVVNDVIDVMDAVDDMADFDSDDEDMKAAPQTPRRKQNGHHHQQHKMVEHLDSKNPAISKTSHCEPKPSPSPPTTVLPLGGTPPSRKNSSALKDVVIHKKEEKSWSSNLIDRVNTVIRKISSESMNHKFTVVEPKNINRTTSVLIQKSNQEREKPRPNLIETKPPPILVSNRQRKVTTDGTFNGVSAVATKGELPQKVRRKSIPPNFHVIGGGSQKQCDTSLEIGGYHFRDQTFENESAGGTRHRRVGVLHHDWSVEAVVAATTADFC